jgi:CRP/FNR family transcriptional regulator
MTFTPAPRGAPLAERLGAFPWVRELAAPDREEVLRAAVPKRLDEGAVVVDAGDVCAVLLLVERGVVRVSRAAGPARSIALYDVEPGESCILGIACIMGERTYPARAVAVAPTDALLVPAALARALVDRAPSLRAFVFGLYAARLGELMALVSEVAFERVDVRLARLLLDEATRVPGAIRPVEASHAELAARLGTAREVVSRVLDGWRGEGLVLTERGRVVVRDVDALRLRANGSA